MGKDKFIEAKSTLLFPELVAGTREVDVEIVRDTNHNPLSVSNVRTVESVYMKMIRFIGDVEGETSVIAFFDYIKKEKPINGLSALTAIATGSSENYLVDSSSQPVRVSCTCGEYKALFAMANYKNDAQQDIKPTEVDPRDVGYRKPIVNTHDIPGVCKHLISLYTYLQRIYKVK